jgi:diguanylate cyclase (GGDEF)-like protein
LGVKNAILVREKKMNDEIKLDSIKSEIISLIEGDHSIGFYPGPNGKQSAIKNSESVSYSRLLKELVHGHFEEEDARNHWKNIIENYNSLKGVFNRDLGIRIAVYDYFLNQSTLFKNALLIDHSMVRKLKHNSLLDHVTGAFNRTYFELYLKKELKRANRYNKVFSLLLLDIDDFKNLNESKGREECDRIIVRLVKLLKHSCREEDVLCRFGLEEFIFFLPETPSLGAFHLAERIKYKLKESGFLTSIGLTLSGGIAEYPLDSRNMFNLIKCADSALYNAKSKGRNKISFFKEKNDIQTIYDSLTGLFNAAHFEYLLTKEHNRAVRHSLAYSLIFIDIDEFNRINDVESAVFGDLALNQFSSLLSSMCRENDILARISGGQFVFFLPDTDGDAGYKFGERLKESILSRCGINDCRYTFSCGVASYPNDGFDFRDIMDYARKACLQAKKGGGDTIIRYTSNRRVTKRYPRAIKVRYRVLENAFRDQRQNELITDDISIQGMRFTITENLLLGTSLIFLFRNSGSQKKELVILGKIVWSKQNSRTSFTYGIRFRDMEEENLDILGKIIKIS